VVGAAAAAEKAVGADKAVLVAASAAGQPEVVTGAGTEAGTGVVATGVVMVAAVMAAMMVAETAVAGVEVATAATAAAWAAQMDWVAAPAAM
jgi:hypothetical protein